MLIRSLLAFGSALVLGGPVAGQASYTGKIGGAPIELLLPSVRQGDGVYLYTKVGTPIILDSDLRRGVLTLTEYTADRLLNNQNLLKTKYKATAKLTLVKFSFSAPTLRGTWRSLATGRQLPLTLTLVTGPGSAGTAAAPPTALQKESTPSYYFKTVLLGPAKDITTRVGAVQVIEKKTNRLLQQFPVNCRSIGQGAVSVDDYNFDGLPDFSIYEDDGDRPLLAQMAFNNTKSQYFLYDPAAKRFTASGFRGVGLEFDARKRRVYEYLPSPSRTRIAMTKVEYRLVNNHLVQVTRQCLEWHPYQGFTPSEPSACQ
jgi:hypothetical protein